MRITKRANGRKQMNASVFSFFLYLFLSLEYLQSSCQLENVC